jgi:hypothetical protein
MSTVTTAYTQLGYTSAHDLGSMTTVAGGGVGRSAEVGDAFKGESLPLSVILTRTTLLLCWGGVACAGADGSSGRLGTRSDVVSVSPFADASLTRRPDARRGRGSVPGACNNTAACPCPCRGASM